MTASLKIPSDVLRVVRTLHKNGFESYLVGGAVRDYLMKRSCKDWDVTTNALPNQVQRIFLRTVPTGKKYGTITVLGKKVDVQVTTYRHEGKYLKYRRPKNVKFVGSLIEDLSRRDFTVNAIAFDPFKQVWIDPFSGMRDIQKKRLRTVGSPEIRFKEDALRIMRAARFISQLEFRPDKNLGKAAKKLGKIVLKISKERVRDELTKLVVTDRPSSGLKWLEEQGILKMILPELSRCKGVYQGGWHQYDVFNHTLQCLDRSQKGQIVRLVLLLHDIAKPRTKTKDRYGYHFYGHDRIGAEMSVKILKRLKYPRSVIESVSHLIRLHLFDEKGALTSESSIRRFIQRVGVESLEALFEVRIGDAKGCGKGRRPGPELKKLQNRIRKVLQTKAPLRISELAVGGNEVMKIFGVPPGPIVGKALKLLLEEVLESPRLNTEEYLKKRLTNLRATMV